MPTLEFTQTNMPRLHHLFVVYRERLEGAGPKVPLVVLQVRDSDMVNLGITSVRSVDPRGLWEATDPQLVARLRELLGREYPSLGQACQRVYARYKDTETRTVYMSSFEVCLRGAFDESQLGTCSTARVVHGERIASMVSPELAACTAESLDDGPDDDDPGEARPSVGMWMPVGLARPYAHTSVPIPMVLAAADRMRREVRASPRSLHLASCEALTSLLPTVRSVRLAVDHRPRSARLALAHRPAPPGAQGFRPARQQPRDNHKRSFAETHPLEEGELREGKKRSGSAKSRAKALEPGRLVFIKSGSADGQLPPQPHVIVSSGLRRLRGMHQAASCVTLEPLLGGELTEAENRRDVPASEVVGLGQEFKLVWLEHAAPGSRLREGMLDAVRRMQEKSEPPSSFSAVWKHLAPGVPEPT